MERPEPLAYLTENDLPSMFRASIAVLVLMRPSSRRCMVYQAEIEQLLANGELDGVPVGGVRVDDAGRLGRLIDALIGKDVPTLPVTVVLREGREVELLLTTRASCLIRRIARDTTYALMIPSLESSTGGSDEWSRPNTLSNPNQP